MDGISSSDRRHSLLTVDGDSMNGRASGGAELDYAPANVRFHERLRLPCQAVRTSARSLGVPKAVDAGRIHQSTRAPRRLFTSVAFTNSCTWAALSWISTIDCSITVASSFANGGSDVVEKRYPLD